MQGRSNISISGCNFFLHTKDILRNSESYRDKLFGTGIEYSLRGILNLQDKMRK